jgi:hypothetical protein
MRTAFTLLLLLTGVAFPLVSVYHLDPVRANWSGRVRPDLGVSELITMNADLPIFADYFTGTKTSQQYQVQLKFPGENGVVVAHGDTTEPRDHVWVRCTLEVDRPDSIIKGRLYEVRWTLSGGDESLRYYYQTGNPYQWGRIRIGGSDGPTDWDLAMRCRGSMRYLDSLDWGATGPCGTAPPSSTR